MILLPVAIHTFWYNILTWVKLLHLAEPTVRCKVLENVIIKFESLVPKVIYLSFKTIIKQCRTSLYLFMYKGLIFSWINVIKMMIFCLYFCLILYFKKYLHWNSAVKSSVLVQNKISFKNNTIVQIFALSENVSFIEKVLSFNIY